MSRRKIIFGIFSLLLFNLLLSACSVSDGGLVARVGDKEITAAQLVKEDLFFASLEKKQGEQELFNRDSSEEAESLEEADRQALEEVQAGRILERRSRVLDQLVYEEMIRQDRDLTVPDLTLRVDALWARAMERFDGQEGLEAQLRAYEMTVDQFRSSLSGQALQEAHRQAYRDANPISTKDLELYFEKEGARCFLVSYTDIGVPTRSGAEEIKDLVSQDPREVTGLTDQYENDVYENTFVVEREEVGIDDEDLPDQDILSQDPESVETYYGDDELYHVILIRKKITEFASLRDHIEKLALDDRYETYIQSLSRQLEVQIFEENIPTAE